MNSSLAERWLPAISVAEAILYFGSIFLLAIFEQNYSHFGDFASDLGRATAAIGFVTENTMGLSQQIAAAVFFVWFIWTCYWIRAQRADENSHG